ncbi:MAG: aspartate aminotransferase family protein [Lachnospiraceae bacterium]|nr:aspartate aminotransferase family protein [Lachnospiraceae bacterium]
MTSNEYIDLTEQHVLHTYNRFPIVFEKGEGVYLTDADGKQYLDFGAGIAVFALGYGNQEYNNALKEQVDNLIHTSNLFYSVPLAEAAAKLTKATGLDKVFFTNSGTEAIEGAIKAARKYAYLKDKNTAEAGTDAAADTHENTASGDQTDEETHANYEIIAMNHSFHGRSVGALSVTGNPHYQEAFRPLMGGVRFADFNDLESVKRQVTDRTCAIILETVQGEGGIYPADPEFLKGVRALCDEKDILLILDEIQCGMGRTGSWFACQQYSVQPDIMTCAKALGCGIPVGAFVLNEKTAKASLVPGDHGTTYGGNPLACAAVSKVFDLFEELHIIEHVQALTPYLEQQLDTLVEKYDYLTARRGKGFMQGIVVEGRPAGEIVTRALENGLVILSAEGNVLRFVPPLVIEKEDIDEMMKRLEAVL